jgi:hypothetical protein
MTPSKYSFQLSSNDRSFQALVVLSIFVETEYVVLGIAYLLQILNLFIVSLNSEQSF